MKKIFCLLTVLICSALLAPTALAADDAYTIYQKFLKKSKSISSMECSVTDRFSMIDDGQSVVLAKQTGTAKMLTTKDNQTQIEMKMTNSDTKDIVYSYFKGNYLYEKLGNEKYKIKMSANDALGHTMDIEMGLTKDNLKNAKVEKVDDGIKITYKEKPSDLNQDFAFLFYDLNLPNDFTTSFTDITMSMTIGDDGMLKSTSSVYGIHASDGNVTLKYRISQVTKVKSVNSVSKISYPSDLNTYNLLKI